MRYTLHTLALSGLLCMGFGSAIAIAQDQAPPPPMQQEGQGPGGPGMHGHGPMSPDQQLQHLTKALNLTADQQTQIKPILDSASQQRMQMRGDSSLSHEDRMTKGKALEEDTHSKISAVLDDKQKAKFQKMMERREEHMDHHGDHQGPMDGPPPSQPQR